MPKKPSPITIIDLTTKKPIAKQGKYEAFLLSSDKNPSGFSVTPATALKIVKSYGRTGVEIVPAHIIHGLLHDIVSFSGAPKDIYAERLFVRVGNGFHAIAKFDGSPAVYKAHLEEQAATAAWHKAWRKMDAAKAKLDRLRAAER